MIVIALLAGCAPEGVELHEWTLEGRAVTLPRNGVAGGLPKRAYTLTTTATLGDAQRGKPLTLIVECFHGDLAVRIDSTPVANIGDTMVGEHRFLISAEQSARGRLDIAIDARGDPISYDFGVSPRLVTGEVIRPSRWRCSTASLR